MEINVGNLSKEESRNLAITLQYHEKLDCLSFKDAKAIWRKAGFTVTTGGWSKLKSDIDKEYNDNAVNYDGVEDYTLLPSNLRDIVENHNRDQGFGGHRGRASFGSSSVGFGGGRRRDDRDDRDDRDEDWSPRRGRRDDRSRSRDRYRDRDRRGTRTRERDRDNDSFSFGGRDRDDRGRNTPSRTPSRRRDFVENIRNEVRNEADRYDNVNTNGASLLDYLSYYFEDRTTVQRAFSFDSKMAIRNANALCDRFAEVVEDWSMTREEAHELKIVLDHLVDFVIGIYRDRDFTVLARIRTGIRGVRREVAAMFWKTVNQSYGQYL